MSQKPVFFLSATEKKKLTRTKKNLLFSLFPVKSYSTVMKMTGIKTNRSIKEIEKKNLSKILTLVVKCEETFLEFQIPNDPYPRKGKRKNKEGEGGGGKGNK